MTRLAAILIRMHVRGASSQQQSIEPVEDLTSVNLRPDSGDQNRQTTGRVYYCIRIPLVNSVENSFFDFAHTAGNTDDRHLTGGHAGSAQGSYWRREAA